MACLWTPFRECCGVTLCSSECDEPTINCCTCPRERRRGNGWVRTHTRRRSSSLDSKTGASECRPTTASTADREGTTVTSPTSTTLIRQAKQPTIDGSIASGTTTQYQPCSARPSSQPRDGCCLGQSDPGRQSRPFRESGPESLIDRRRRRKHRVRWRHRRSATARPTKTCRCRSEVIPRTRPHNPRESGVALESRQ